LADRGRRPGAENQVKGAATFSATGLCDDCGEPEQIADFAGDFGARLPPSR